MGNFFVQRQRNGDLAKSRSHAGSDSVRACLAGYEFSRFPSHQRRSVDIELPR